MNVSYTTCDQMTRNSPTDTDRVNQCTCSKIILNLKLPTYKRAKTYYIYVMSSTFSMSSVRTAKFHENCFYISSRVAGQSASRNIV